MVPILFLPLLAKSPRVSYFFDTRVNVCVKINKIQYFILPQSMYLDTVFFFLMCVIIFLLELIFRATYIILIYNYLYYFTYYNSIIIL